MLIRPTSQTNLTRGNPGAEAGDYGYNFANARRRSNSSTHGSAIADFKTKFEAVEADPVFEESYHGPVEEFDEEEIHSLDKQDTAEISSSGSIEEEEHAKKV